MEQKKNPELPQRINTELFLLLEKGDLVKIEINFSNKVFYTLIILTALVLLGAGVYAYTQSIPNPGHGADKVLISINGQEKTLQAAVDAGDFSSGGNCYTNWGTQTCATGYTAVLTGKTGGLENYYTAGIGGIPRSSTVCVADSASAIESWYPGHLAAETYWNRLMRSNANDNGMNDVDPLCSICCKGGTYTAFGTTTCAVGYNIIYTGRAGGTEFFNSGSSTVGNYGGTLCINDNAVTEQTWSGSYTSRLMRHKLITASDTANGMDQVEDVCVVCGK